LNGYCSFFNVDSGQNVQEEKGGNNLPDWKVERIPTSHNGHNFVCGIVKIGMLDACTGATCNYGGPWFIKVTSGTATYVLAENEDEVAGCAWDCGSEHVCTATGATTKCGGSSASGACTVDKCGSPIGVPAGHGGMKCKPPSATECPRAAFLVAKDGVW
jgi:hypothetical protein